MKRENRIKGLLRSGGSERPRGGTTDSRRCVVESGLQPVDDPRVRLARRGERAERTVGGTPEQVLFAACLCGDASNRLGERDGVDRLIERRQYRSVLAVLLHGDHQCRKRCGRLALREKFGHAGPNRHRGVAKETLERRARVVPLQPLYRLDGPNGRRANQLEGPKLHCRCPIGSGAVGRDRGSSSEAYLVGQFAVLHGSHQGAPVLGNMEGLDRGSPNLRLWRSEVGHKFGRDAAVAVLGQLGDGSQANPEVAGARPEEDLEQPVGNQRALLEHPGDHVPQHRFGLGVEHARDEVPTRRHPAGCKGPECGVANSRVGVLEQRRRLRLKARKRKRLDGPQAGHHLRGLTARKQFERSRLQLCITVCQTRVETGRIHQRPVGHQNVALKELCRRQRLPEGHLLTVGGVGHIGPRKPLVVVARKDHLFQPQLREGVDRLRLNHARILGHRRVDHHGDLLLAQVGIGHAQAAVAVGHPLGVAEHAEGGRHRRLNGHIGPNGVGGHGNKHELLRAAKVLRGQRIDNARGVELRLGLRKRQPDEQGDEDHQTGAKGSNHHLFGVQGSTARGRTAPRGYRGGQAVSRNGPAREIPAAAQVLCLRPVAAPLPRGIRRGYKAPLLRPSKPASMPDAPPAVCYYRPLVGRWSGSFDRTVGDRSERVRALDQTTRIEGRHLRLCQQTAWSAGEVRAAGQP